MLSSWQSRTSRSFSVLRQAFTTDPEVHERIRGSSGWQMTYSFCPYGLWVSMRYLVWTGTRLSGGLHRRSGVILDSSSANFFGTLYRLGKRNSRKMSAHGLPASFTQTVKCAAWFNSGYTLTRQSTFSLAVICSASAPRSSGKMTSMRMLGPSMDTRSCVSLWRC